jgi:hypothetical protein
MEVAAHIEDYVKTIKGIEAVFPLAEEDRLRLLDIEVAAEKKCFMGLGMCYNSGIREVLRSSLVFLGITTMDFDWGCQSHMILKKGEDIVGEDVYEKSRIEELKKRKDVWFLHRNFVIYKGKVDFPRDLVEKKCCFELPALTCGDLLPVLNGFGDYLLCFPSTPGDTFLKDRYFGGADERGMGTVLFGFKIRQ